MKCPRCQGKTRVTKTYPHVGVTVRRRLCISCGYSFITAEREERPGRKHTTQEAH